MTLAGSPPTGPVGAAEAAAGRPVVRRAPALTTGVGAFFTCMGGVHVGIVAADTGFYATFADGAWLGFVRDGWAEVFMAAPAVWGLLLAAAEVTTGVLLLVGGRAARVGWVLAVVFHLLLALFGPGTWVWCVPALALLAWGLRRDWSRLVPAPG
jgi:hypothetical protein